MQVLSTTKTIGKENGHQHWNYLFTGPESYRLTHGPVKKELENEKDLSKVSKKILLAIQDKAEEVQKDLQESAAPQKLAEELKENVLRAVNSDEFKSLPQRSMNAFAAFMKSDDVQKMKARAMQAIKDKQMEAEASAA